MNQPDAFFIVGPTGSGKSSVAIEIAEAVSGTIINGDAYQLYQGLETLTASPSQKERDRVPHLLYGTLRPTEDSQAASYAEMAQREIDAVRASGRTPIVVGGSGLYIKALTHGLGPIPPSDPEVRAKIAEKSLEEQLRQLDALDPATGATIDRQNPRYVSRALEICLVAGEPASSLRHWERTPGLVGVYLHHEREFLYERINLRTPKMLDGGAIDEVSQIGEVGETCGKTLGLQSIQRYLAGALSRPELEAEIQQLTRRYAKRQMTWFRKEACFQTICLSRDADPHSATQQILREFPRDLFPQFS
jgi:tRNA dimethylallyltransferase